MEGVRTAVKKGDIVLAVTHTQQDGALTMEEGTWSTEPPISLRGKRSVIKATLHHNRNEGRLQSNKYNVHVANRGTASLTHTVGQVGTHHSITTTKIPHTCRL